MTYAKFNWNAKLLIDSSVKYYYSIWHTLVTQISLELKRLGKTIWPLLHIYNRILRPGEHKTRREKISHSPGRIIRGTKSDEFEAPWELFKNFFHSVALTFSDLGGVAAEICAPFAFVFVICGLHTAWSDFSLSRERGKKGIAEGPL